MNRKLKFRAFIYNMFGGFMIPTINSDCFMASNGDGFTIYDENKNALKHNEFELMQFTNLHDKKGNEIYEGDVLQTRSGIGYMVFDNCGYAIKSPGSEAVDCEFSAFYLECEIIGNIYENPELIS